MQRTESKIRMIPQRARACVVHPRRAAARFYQAVKKRGYIGYLARLAQFDAWCVGCIGHFQFGEAGISGTLAAIADMPKPVGVRRAPAAAAA
ncbi:hypothetical protein [Burkholderia latens]|uniref:2-aminoethylphosphonate:pyruvate aminotransferase n=2 Tax=Burkholderia latens TaxID=488446 RepID=A0A6P2MRX2_9BURK|nr:hypothetical protein [Burkholderia latens]VWB84569.1 2-aminoethylphosphonate:pyruvate aminotransferase [Burkholderia latens]